jgi:hypothetical protein
MIKTLSPEEKANITSFSADERKDFVVRAKNLFGDKLKAALCAVTSTKRTATTSTTFRNPGRYLDEVELAAEFKDRPEQLSAIVRNADKIQCPVREVTLYLVPKPESIYEEHNTIEDETSISASGSMAKPAEKKLRRNDSTASSAHGIEIQYAKGPTLAEIAKNLGDECAEVEVRVELLQKPAFEGVFSETLKNIADLTVTRAQTSLSCLQLYAENPNTKSAKMPKHDAMEATKECRAFKERLEELIQKYNQPDTDEKASSSGGAPDAQPRE